MTGSFADIDAQAILGALAAIEQAGGPLAVVAASVLLGLGIFRGARSPLRYRRVLAWAEAGVLLLVSAGFIAFAGRLRCDADVLILGPGGVGLYLALAALCTLGVLVAATLRLLADILDTQRRIAGAPASTEVANEP